MLYYIFSNRLSKEVTSKLKSGSDNLYGKWNAEILRLDSQDPKK